MTDPRSNDPAQEAASSATAAHEGEEIRDRARELASQVLRGGKVDPQGVEEVVRSIIPGPPGRPEAPAGDRRQTLLDALPETSEALNRCAAASTAALEKIGAKGVDFTDNDLKVALAALSELQQAYVNATNVLADTATGNVQSELRRLAGITQRASTDAGVQTAKLMSEFASRLSSASQAGAAGGFEAARDYGVRMSMLASGVLAGFADAMSQAADPPDDE